MAQFINKKESLVTEAIDGSLRLSSQARLDGYPHIKVVTRSDIDNTKVALVSGGGSGHEPAHGAFVGKGMLTAAVCGEVFASPSVDAVLAAILHVTGAAGCLLIVKNYTGDRLNFGLAAERAKALGKQVEMIIVGDDVALPDIAQPRGVAGTLLVHKIAGHIAEKGGTLAEVAAAARSVSERVMTYAASLTSCDVPGTEKDASIPAGQIELGLGIHGEAGIRTVAFKDADAIASTIVSELMKAAGDQKQVMLLNNLGSTTALEMSILTNAILTLPEAAKIKAVVGPAPLMTALNMHGFSVSILPATEEFMEALGSPVGCIAWTPIVSVSAVSIHPLPAGLAKTQYQASTNSAVEELILDCCKTFTSIEAELNALDAKTGDGDTGSTLATAANALAKSLPTLPLADNTELMYAISNQLETTMGGSSGVLLAIFFAAAGDALSQDEEFAAALQHGLLAIQEYGGAAPGHRTMIDALAPALSAMAKGHSLQLVAEAARSGANTTAGMTSAKAGRSAYLPEQSLSGVVDPGAEAVAKLFEACANRS